MYGDQHTSRRSIVAASLGCHLLGAALPHPCPDDPDTLHAGILKRFALMAPQPKVNILDEVMEFTWKYCAEHLQPLRPDVDLSKEHWFDGTAYPLWRKEQLKKKWDDIGCRLKNKHRYWVNKSHQKDEPYNEYKHARAINSRTDEYKVEVGPMFKLIEKEVFKLKEFVKNVPVKDRPAYILEHLAMPGGKIYPTDYSAFESLFTRELMEACEFVLYEYMTQFLAEGDQFMEHVRDVQGGTNECVFKFFRLWIHAKRMSGEMCTSLGNGWANLIFTKFVAFKHGLKVLSVHEGDDGLVVSDKDVHTEWFTELGLLIKMERVESIEEASFCGIIFDPVDCINITDPRDVLASFGWTTHQYANARTGVKKTLLRCKALSLIHQYPGCPILQELGLYGLRVTRSYDVRGFVEKMRGLNMWEREQLQAAIRDYRPGVCVEPGERSRRLMERMYGITVEQQLEIENYLKALNVLQPLDLPQVLMHVHPHWVHYWDNYVLPAGYGDYPPSVWRKLPGFQREW